MIRRLQRSAAAFVVVGALALPASATAAQRPDFSGNWELDRSASRINTQYGLAGLGTPAPNMLYITQTGGETLILSSRIRDTQSRGYEFDDTVMLLGLEGENDKILVRSRVRGLSLVSEGGGRVAGETVRMREVLTIASTGLSLQLEVTTTIGGETLTNTLVYRRAGRSATRTPPPTLRAG